MIFSQVSPFAGDAAICPKSFSPKFARATLANAGCDITLDNVIRMQTVMFPQSPEAMGEILFDGYRDAVHFLQKHGQIKHTVELTVKTKYSPKEILKVGAIFLNRLLHFLKCYISYTNIICIFFFIICIFFLGRTQKIHHK